MDTKFNKENAIENWIRETASKKSLTADDERELRTHFVESIEILQKNGLSEEEAFAVARIRTGSSDLVAAEFGKINGPNMLNHEWVFLFYGAGLAVVLYQLTQLISFFVADKAIEGFLSIGQSAWLLSSFYLLLFVGVAIMFKNGELISKFFKRLFFQSGGTINLLFAVLVSLFMILPINYFLGSGKSKDYWQKLMEISHHGSFHEFIFRGAFPLLLFITIFLASPYVRNKFTFKEIMKANNYFYILLLSLVVEVIAAICSRMLISSGIAGYVAYGAILFLELIIFSYYNKDAESLLLKQVTFISIPLCIEISAVIVRSEGNIFTSPLLGFGIAALSSSVSGILVGRALFSKK